MKTRTIGIDLKAMLVALSLILTGTTLWGQYLELDNDTLHLKQDLVRGGAISYLSLSGSDRNLVNIHDEGRTSSSRILQGKQ